MDDSLSFLTKGSQVEVTSDEPSFTGAWFVATVIHPPPLISTTPNNLVYVEYHHLFSTNSSSPTSRLREYANVAYVRPSPQRIPLDSVKFQLNDVVDAFCRDGWWTGVVSDVFDKDFFEITVRNPVDRIRVHISDLRVHRKWVDGKWVLPHNQRTAGLMFDVGKKVEVSFEKETLRDVWFPATILKKSANNSFLVEYQQPGIGDKAVLHKVTVDYLHIRPTPPHLRDKNFVLLEKVDAFYDFGWWSGVITKELADNRYNVFFKHTKKEREFVYSKVRPHMEWKGGKWFNTSQGDTDGRTLMDKQSEQTSPNISRKSTVETSLMKTTKQPTILDNIDNNLLPSEKSTDEIMLDDPSKIILESSAGQFQSEGFDSEISGMNDQSFGKTENLSHGKKVRGKRGKSTELKTPTSDSSRKRGKLSNELKGLQASEDGAKVDSVKTRAQEIAEKTDVTKDFTLPVVSVKTRAQEIAEKTDVTKDFTLPVVSVKTRAQEIVEKTDVTKDFTLPVVSLKTKAQEVAEKTDVTKDFTLPVVSVKTRAQEIAEKTDVTKDLTLPVVSVKTRAQEIAEKNDVTKDLTLPVVSVNTSAQEIAEKTNVTKDFTLPVVMGLQGNGMKISQGKLLQKLPDEKIPDVAESDTIQPDVPLAPVGVPLASLDVPLAPLDVPLAPLTMVDKDGSEEANAASVPPKRKRGRPPKLQAKTPEDPVAVEVNHGNEGVDPSVVSLVESVQTDEIGLPIVEKQPELSGQDDVPTSKDKLPIENPVQGLHVQRGTKKYSSKKGRRGKRRTISVNTTEAPAQDSQGASKEKGDGILEKDSTTKSPEPSFGKSLTTMSDDQPLSSWFDGIHTPMTGNVPDGNMEQSSSQLQIVPCDMDVANLPFVRSTPLWKTIESMEVFQKIPQRPHFRPLFEDVVDFAREGLAIGKMVTFTNVVERTCRLRFDDPKSMIEDCLGILVELEPYGFEVEVIRDRLTGLLSLKDKEEVMEEESKGAVEKVEENKIRGKIIEEEIDEFDRQLRELEEKRELVMLKKEKTNSEIAAMKATVEKIEEEMKKIGAEFDRLAAAPF